MGWLGFAKCDLDFATHERDIISSARGTENNAHSRCGLALHVCPGLLQATPRGRCLLRMRWSDLEP